MNNFAIDSLTIIQKRDLVKQLREAIKTDLVLSKARKASLKQAKEIEKKQKLENAIKLAAEKLAKLQAKLA